MPSRLRYFVSDAVRALVPAGLLALALGNAVPLGGQTAPPRPRIAVAVAIDAPFYRQRLGGGAAACEARCRQLTGLMETAVRDQFTRQFAFAEWVPAGTSAPDTIAVVWAASGTTAVSNLVARFTVLGRMRSARASPTALRWETWGEAANRTSWEPTTVAQEWQRKLAALLVSQRVTLMSDVFVHVPIGGTVNVARQLEAQVQLRPEWLRAATDQPIAFVVRLGVNDPGPPFAVRDTAAVVLDNCRGSAPLGFVCHMGDFNYGPIGKPKSIVTGDRDRQALAARATMRPATLHLRLYYPADPLDGLAGMPGGRP